MLRFGRTSVLFSAPGHAAESTLALDAAHADGIVHGTLTARNVLIDGEGRPFLSDLGFGAADATAGANRRVFAALVAEFLGDGGGSGHVAGPSAAALLRAAPAPPSTRRHRRPALALAVAAIVAAVALVAHLAVGRDGPATPPPLRGTEPLGSALDAAGVRSQDCTGRPPSGASPACTLMQTGLPGRPLVAARDGAVVGWAVRGAGGELALQVIRKRRGRFAVVAASPYSASRTPASTASRSTSRSTPAIGSASSHARRGDRDADRVAEPPTTGFTTAAGRRRPDRGRAEDEVFVRRLPARRCSAARAPSWRTGCQGSGRAAPSLGGL